jgi:hypothetical protein
MELEDFKNNEPDLADGVMLTPVTASNEPPV